MLSNNLDNDLRRDLFFPFKLPYDHDEEVRMRLLGTIVQYNSQPIFITNIGFDHDHEDVTLYGRFEERGQDRTLYLKDPAWDFRPLKSGYITKQGDVYWMERSPTRMSQQGMSQRNTFLKRVGDIRNINVGPISSLLKPLSERFILTWNDTWEGMLHREHIRCLRLSDDIAVKLDDVGMISMYYRQRSIGLVKDDIVKLDDMDIQCPWITGCLEKVGIRGEV